MDKLQASRPSLLRVRSTGTCFEDVTWMFIAFIREHRHLWHDPTFVIVHGIVKPAGYKSPYAHAWIEHEDDTVYTVFIDKKSGEKIVGEFGRRQFYGLYNVIETTKYTAPQAKAEALKHNDLPPPWEEKYRVLCKDHKQQDQTSQRQKEHAGEDGASCITCTPKSKFFSENSTG